MFVDACYLFIGYLNTKTLLKRQTEVDAAVASYTVLKY